MKERKVSFIIQAKNEEEYIADVLKEIKKLEPMEIIVVVNGSTDSTVEIVRSMGCNLINYKSALGINMGKAIGAVYAKGDILVFHDSDIVVEAEKFIPFIDAIKNGYDIALNDIKWTVYDKNKHPTAISKRALNIFLQREDLLVNSLGAIPNAMSKEVVNKIGWWNLVDPPLAQTLGIMENLMFKVVEPINVINNNPIRREEHRTKPEGSPFAKSTSRIIGDHIQAINHISSVRGNRGGYYDGRERDFLNSINMQLSDNKIDRSVVITAEGKTKRRLRKIIIKLKEMIQEVIVVGYQLTEEEIIAAEQLGAKVINYPHSLGLYVSRAIGASHCSGSVILFTDNNLNLSAQDYIPFIDAVEKGSDMALNNMDYLLDIIQPHDSLSIVKLFFNIILKEPRLLNNSLNSIPFAIRRDIIEKVGVKNLAVPPLFLLIAKLNNFTIDTSSTIKIKSVYDICPEHINEVDKYKALDIFLGDYLEAIEYFINITDVRGGFTDGDKNRALLESLKKSII